MGAIGPLSKGVWNRKKDIKKLSDKATSTKHITVRKKEVLYYGKR